MRGKSPTIACFTIGDTGHVHRTLPVVAGLRSRGADVHVFCSSQHRSTIEGAGGRFHDLHAGRPLEGADAESIPRALRFVTFAGMHGEEVAEEAATLNPDLVLYDTFSVVGRVVAKRLDLPHVNIVAGHDLHPQRTVEAVHADLAVHISEGCRRAVDVLRDRIGLSDATPFTYAWTRSPHLNLVGEPGGFLPSESARALDPVAFFGSLPSPEEIERRSRVPTTTLFGASPPPLRVLASFGTIVWRFFAKEALQALDAIATAVEGRRDAVAVLGLGGHDVPSDAVRRLMRARVRVEPYVDQWNVLRSATAFVTHNGLNSTHEAVFLGVPMLSYPFFWDQPALAERCRSLGLSVPLASRPRAPITADDVSRGLDELAARGSTYRSALDRAGAEERATLKGRGAILDRMLALCV